MAVDDEAVRHVSLTTTAGSELVVAQPSMAAVT